MKLKLLVLILLTSSLMLALAPAQPGNQSRQVIALDPTGKYLVNQSTGKPTFMTGDSPQTPFVQVSDADVETYLKDRASRKFNALWLLPVDKTDQANAPKNFYGQTPFDGPDFTNEDPAYWAHVDHVMQRIEAYGMIAVLDPAFVGVKSSDGYLDSYLNSSDEVMKAYGAWIGKRFRNYPNVIWSLGGDACPSTKGLYGKLNDLAQGIRSADPHHMFTLESCRQLSMLDVWTQSTPLNLNWVYGSYTSIQAQCARDYSRSGALPAFAGEDFYEGEHSMTALMVREETYWEVLSGCTLGRLFGNNAIWTMGGPLDTMGKTWQSQLASAGSLAEQWQGALMRSREFWKLVPDSSNAVLAGGIGSGTSISVAACASDGQTCIVYDPAGNSQAPQIAMSHFSGAVHGWWFNPSSGVTTDLGALTNSGTRTFRPPDGNDWVLVLDLKSANLPAPGSKDL
jgi:Protein of unknown function (DUF4038)/Putative collagen-binding domain of a collagenase